MHAIIKLSPLALLGFIASCGNYVYRPVALRTPLLKDQHDFCIQTNVSNAGGEIYTAYAPTHFLAFSVGYAGVKDSSSVGRYKFKDLEFAVTPFLAKDKLRLEIPMGTAITRQISLSSKFQTFQPYQRYFVQPTIGFSSDIFDIALAHRMTFIDYSNAAYRQDLRQQTSIIMRVGYKYTKFMIQFGTEYGTQNTDLVDYWPYHVAFGMHFQFNGKRDFFPPKTP